VYQDRQLVYRPTLMARASVRIDNTTHNVHERLTTSRVLSLPEKGTPIAWSADPLSVDIDELDNDPAHKARFAPLPGLMADERWLKRMEREYADYVYRETALRLLRHRVLKLTARPDEPETQFKRRCYKEIKARRDEEVRKLQDRYDSRIDRLEDRIRREMRELEQDEAEYEARKREELLAAGESILNLITRRRSSRMLSVASRRRRLTQQSKADVKESREQIEDLKQEQEELFAEIEQEKARIHERWADAADDIETIQIRPRKSDIFVEAWGVIWLPYWDVVYMAGGEQQKLSLPAFELNPA